MQKMIGAMTILISLMKASPSGFIEAPVDGAAIPSAMPHAIATSTQKYSELRRFPHKIRIRPYWLRDAGSLQVRPDDSIEVGGVCE